MSDPQVVTPKTSTTGLSTRIHTSPEEVQIDYLKDIRNQLIAIKDLLSRILDSQFGG